MQHHIGDGFSDNIGAADNDHLGTAGFNSGTDDHLLNTGRCAGGKSHLVSADHQPAHINRMKSIHIFVGINGIQHLFVIDMFGEGKLDQNSVDVVVVIISFNQGQKILFGNIFRLAVLNFTESKSIGCLNLERNIGHGSGIFPNQNSDKPGNNPVLFFDFRYFFLNFVKNYFANFGPFN